MRHFFTHKEIKLKKKRTAIAVIGIGLVLGIYFIVSRRPAHQQETPVVAIEPVTREDVEIYGEYVGRIRAQQFVEVRARVEGLNPEKPDVPLNKNDAFQKVQKRRVQEKR